jgi:hypothetical protein
MVELEVTVTGPLFNGTATAELKAALDDIEKDVAQQAYANVMTNLEGSIQHPTPYYETQVIAQNMATSWVVHDRGIIYGPWLEGTGSRNRTTRFKGYASFRKAAQKTEAEAVPIAEHALAPHLARMQ